MTTTSTWTGTLTATSSIAHGGETRGTITLLRRERVLTPDGQILHVPLVSGNALRGRLRRVSEELMRDVLHYEGQLPLAAAHALRGGGALAKVTGEPLSGARLAHVRALVPHLAIFGAAAGGRIIDGALQVGRLTPHLAETEYLTGRPGPDLFSATQLESYTRLDDASTVSFTAMTSLLTPDGAIDEDAAAAAGTAAASTGPGPMLFRVETFPAGTRFSSWIRLERATDLAAAYFTDVLAAFTARGGLGGRAAIGHGQVRPDWTRTDQPTPPAPSDWREHLTGRRDEILHAITQLT